MRYRETGDVHLDFHRSMNGTITYLRERYGIEMLDDLLRRTATDVYRAIRADLTAGNPEHLLEHWTYFLTYGACPPMRFLGEWTTCSA